RSSCLERNDWWVVTFPETLTAVVGVSAETMRAHRVGESADPCRRGRLGFLARIVSAISEDSVREDGGLSATGGRGRELGQRSIDVDGKQLGQIGGGPERVANEVQPVACRVGRSLDGLRGQAGTGELGFGVDRPRRDGTHTGDRDPAVTARLVVVDG